MANMQQSITEENRIPMFTVYKNNANFKNIFVISHPAENSPPIAIEGYDEVLLVGRHPDCNIVLEHPSISRFHLRIYSKPTSCSLSVVDLSSVHGTWVSEKKIEPNVHVELKEGDTMRIGGSSRIYKLHWLPLSRAYDSENPFAPDELDENSPTAAKNSGSLVKQLPPTAPPMLEDVKVSLSLADEDSPDIETSQEWEKHGPGHGEGLNNILLAPLLAESGEENHCPQASSVPLDTETPKSSIKQSGKEQKAVDNVRSSFSNEAAAKTPVVETPERLPAENIESPPAQSVTGCKPASVLQLQAGNTMDCSSENISDSGCSLPSIQSQKCTPASVLQLQTSRTSKKKCMDTGTNVEGGIESISRALFHASDGEEEIFTPDKENLTPNTLKLRSIKRMETQNFKSYRPSPLKAAAPSPCSHGFASSEKENRMPQAQQERRPLNIETASRTKGRTVFQSLSMNSATTKSSNSVNYRKATGGLSNSNPFNNNSAGEGKKSWNMVVDATCLLNQESRKSLQLLQGLKGTRLIIPRIVIRELDCLRRRCSFFRKTTDVSSTLLWIEECMVKTKWWIHVQCSTEVGGLIAPTPPASSPRSRVSDGCCGDFLANSVPFSGCGGFMQIISPTAEDHILDYALLCRRVMEEGQLVILSDDVTLKIKAMAEGLMCERAEEFRESLVNPFSGRFLWAESSPRGLTWCCSEDLVLKEKYESRGAQSSRVAEVAKGLKLILVHNAEYGQVSLPSPAEVA